MLPLPSSTAKSKTGLVATCSAAVLCRRAVCLVGDGEQTCVLQSLADRGATPGTVLRADAVVCCRWSVVPPCVVKALKRLEGARGQNPRLGTAQKRTCWTTATSMGLQRDCSAAVASRQQHKSPRRQGDDTTWDLERLDMHRHVLPGGGHPGAQVGPLVRVPFFYPC